MSTTKPAIPVKSCYSHIGGRLGSLLMEQFIENGWIKKEGPETRHHAITLKGEKAFTEMGIDLTLIPRETTN